MPSFWAALERVRPLPSKRFPSKAEIARSSQTTGVREEVEVMAGLFAIEGIGTSGPTDWSGDWSSGMVAGPGWGVEVYNILG